MNCGFAKLIKMMEKRHQLYCWCYLRVQAIPLCVWSKWNKNAKIIINTLATCFLWIRKSFEARKYFKAKLAFSALLHCVSVWMHISHKTHILHTAQLHCYCCCCCCFAPLMLLTMAVSIDLWDNLYSLCCKKCIAWVVS